MMMICIRNLMPKKCSSDPPQNNAPIIIFRKCIVVGVLCTAVSNIVFQLFMPLSSFSAILTISTDRITEEASSEPVETTFHFKNNEIPALVKRPSVLINNTDISQDLSSFWNSFHSQGAKDDVMNSDCFQPRPIDIDNLPEKLPPKPWIHLGLPKTGTTSLEYFWKCGGLEVGHSVCKVTNDYLLENRFDGKGGGPEDGSICPSNRVKGPGHCKHCAKCMQAAHQYNLSLIESCGNYPAYAQMDGTIATCYWPQLEGLDLIHEEVPNATFVFMFRDVDEWISSFKIFRGGQSKRKFKKCQGKMTYNEGVQDDQLKRFYCNVVQHARNFVANHPSHALYEIDMGNPETPSIISRIFGINSSCWGVHNVNGKLGLNRTFITVSDNTTIFV